MTTIAELRKTLDERLIVGGGPVDGYWFCCKECGGEDEHIGECLVGALETALEGWEEAESVIREVWEHCDSIPDPISQYVVGKTFSK